MGAVFRIPSTDSMIALPSCLIDWEVRDDMNYTHRIYQALWESGVLAQQPGRKL